MYDFTYPNTRRVSYLDTCGEHGEALFVPVCPHCGRYVKAAESISVNGLGEIKDEPNAWCSRCGNVTMPFEGWW